LFMFGYIKFFGHCVASINHQSNYNKDQHGLALVYSVTSAHNSSLMIYRIMMTQTYTHNTDMYLKDRLSLKIKTLHIHLYFTVTQYLCKYTLVEDIDN